MKWNSINPITVNSYILESSFSIYSTNLKDWPSIFTKLFRFNGLFGLYYNISFRDAFIDMYYYPVLIFISRLSQTAERVTNKYGPNNPASFA